MVFSKRKSFENVYTLFNFNSSISLSTSISGDLHRKGDHSGAIAALLNSRKKPPELKQANKQK